VEDGLFHLAVKYEEVHNPFLNETSEIVDHMLSAGNKISTQTGIGTAVAIGGVALYSFIKAKLEEEKRAKAATS
jgi:hypothetical protein